MFPKLRRNSREFTEGLHEVFEETDHCHIAMNSPLGYPYVVAVNHVLYAGKLYFHCATEGFKLDCLARDNRVCVKALLRSQVVSSQYTTDFKSVVAFGRAVLVEDQSLKKVVLTKLMERFSPGHPITKACAHDGALNTGIVEVTLEHITGKENNVL